MQFRWYTIQIDIPSTEQINPNYPQDHIFWCVLLTKQPQYSKKSDKHSIWWPDWYKYSTCNRNKQIIFSKIVLSEKYHTCKCKIHPMGNTY